MLPALQERDSNRMSIPGRMISGGKPELVSLDYTPILYVTEDAPVYQVVKAIVDSPLGPGAVALSINGPEMNFTEESKGSLPERAEVRLHLVDSLRRR